MKDRIQEIIEQEKLSNADFATKIKVSPATISAVLNGRNNPSLDLIVKIHQAYPKISLAWLMDGEGEMLSGKTDNRQPDLFDEIPVNPEQTDVNPEYGKEIGLNVADIRPNTIVKQEVKYVEKPHPKITEIRVFFDDNTYEIFKPEK